MDEELLCLLTSDGLGKLELNQSGNHEYLLRAFSVG
jgi:hypothetical protein